MDTLAKEITWRGVKYELVALNDNNEVEWFCPRSGHKQHCSIEAWKLEDPYDYKSK